MKKKVEEEGEMGGGKKNEGEIEKIKIKKIKKDVGCLNIGIQSSFVKKVAKKLLFPDNIRNSWTKICTSGENNVMEKQIFSPLVIHCYVFQKSGWKYRHTAWNGKILSIYKKKTKRANS